VILTPARHGACAGARGTGNAEMTQQEFNALKPGDVIMHKKHDHIMMVVVESMSGVDGQLYKIAQYISHSTNEYMIGVHNRVYLAYPWVLVTA
jgi:hypothetical protein